MAGLTRAIAAAALTVSTSRRLMAWVLDVPRAEVEAAGTWGPLAVVEDDATDGHDAGLGPGRLVITDRCVFIKGSPTSPGTSLISRSGQTRWRPGGRTITYTDRDLGEITLRACDRILLGGFSIGTAAAPDNVEIPRGPWIRELDPSCPVERWMVQQVVPEGTRR